MSAIALDRPMVAPSAARRRSLSVRPFAVPSGARVTVDRATADDLHVAEAVESVRPVAWRLNRRGRLVRTLVMLALAALIVSMITARLGAASAADADHATTVLPGQTLSDIAHEQLPHLPVADAVAVVQVANGLNSTQVVAGQSLLIPAS